MFLTDELRQRARPHAFGQGLRGRVRRIARGREEIHDCMLAQRDGAATEARYFAYWRESMICGEEVGCAIAFRSPHDDAIV